MILDNVKTVVIKIGSSTIVDEKGDIRKKWIESLAEDIGKYSQKHGIRFVIVSSGAVAAGRRLIAKENKAKLKLEEKQAAAACGQPVLMKYYDNGLKKHRYNVAQVLLTVGDIENRRSYLNAKTTFETLINSGIVPIVNENDTVATQELRVGDNDRLSAYVAQMIGADLLIIFSDIEGLYTEDPRKNKDAKHIKTVKKVDAKIRDLAGGAGSSVGTGGMKTKIDAAKIAGDSGCDTIIASGRAENPVEALVKGGKHTIFKSKTDPVKARHGWILNKKTSGKITIDDGAKKAVCLGKSLLPVGIKKIEGKFLRGDVIAIFDLKKNEIGKGVVEFDSVELKKIMGEKSENIENILGYSGRNYAVHSNDLALLDD